MLESRPRDLVGIWDTDAPEEYPSHSTETLIFKPDGTGRFETTNFVLCSADFFHWSVGADGRLTLRGYKTLAIDERGQPVEEPPEFEFVGVPYLIEAELTPTQQTIPTLVIQFGRPFMPDRFWLIRRDLTGYEEPSF